MRKLPSFKFFSTQNNQSPQTLFWINGQSILVVTAKKRKVHQFNTATGFIENKVADFTQALASIKKICRENNIDFGNLLVRNKAIIFIPTNSSPLERELFTKLFKQAGFFGVELINYATAFRAFLAKQDLDKGSFVYIGQEISEIGVFDRAAQQSFIVYYSLREAIDETIYFFREKHLFELAEKVAFALYQEIGNQGEKFSLVVRGRNSRTKDLQTMSFLFKDVEPLASSLQRKITKELDSIVQNNLFKQIGADKWVILGDDFFKKSLDHLGEKSLRLKTEFDLMQGVEWL
ncbi:MAG: hypothetical protein ACOZAK_01145 [Patescibacteria group bacterium]